MGRRGDGGPFTIAMPTQPDNEGASALPFRNLTDYDVILESQNVKNVIKEKMTNNGFKQFLENHRANLDDTFNPTEACNYYDNDDFKTTISKLNCEKSIFHANVRRIAKNRGNLMALLTSLEYTFDIIILTEIGDDASHYLHSQYIPGYEIFLDTPVNNKYGGVAILVRNSIGKIFQRCDLSISMSCQCENCKVENMWIQIESNDEIYIIGGIYRHPNGNVSHFNNELLSCIEKIPSNVTCFYVGDINIDLLKISQKDQFDYFTSLAAKNFQPCITLPTRITDYSMSLVDHIFFRAKHKLHDAKLVSGNIFSDISDHLPTFCIFENSNIKPKASNRPLIRLFSERNICSFVSHINNTDWYSVIGSDHSEAMATRFHEYIKKIYEKCFPLVRLSNKRAKDKKWITSALKKSTKRKNLLYKKRLDHPSAENIRKYNAYRNILTTCLRVAEAMYYHEELSDQTNATVKFWKLFGATLRPRNCNKNSNFIKKLFINNEMISDDQDISNKMNEFFCTVGDNLSKTIPKIPGSFTKYLKNKLDETFFINPVTEQEVMNCMKQLNPKKSAGHDALSPRLIRLCMPALVGPLTTLYNKSISDACFPSLWKFAKVIALYKKNSRCIPDNYRPISLLSCFGKIFERLIFNKMIKFIDKHKILYIKQFGFRKKYSTILALIDLVDVIKSYIDNNDYAIGIFLDIKKAFDTVNHDILLSKLQHYGFRGHFYEFIKSYLNARTQYTVINGKPSDILQIRSGVPQGSILGPLLFLLYVNDMPDAISITSDV